MVWLLLILAAGDSQARLAAALAAEQQGDEARALVDLEQLSRDEPGNPLPHLEVGRLLLKRGERLPLAEWHLDVARSLAPENPRAHFLWAQVSQETGHPLAARQALEVALTLRPGFLDARYQLAGLLFAQGDYQAAVPHYRAWTAAHPEATAARLQLADALDRAGWPDQAEAELRALMSGDATRLVAGRKLLALLEREGKARDVAKLQKKLKKDLEPEKKKPLRDLKPSSR